MNINTNKNTNYRVLVTGIGGGGHGEQVLKALKLSGRYFIVGTDIHGECSNRNKVDQFKVLPRADAPEYLDELIALAQRYHCKAVFHGSEAEMMVLSQRSSELKAADIYVPVNPPSVMKICQDKAATMAFLSAQGFRVPFFREICSAADLRCFDHFPAVIKPSQDGGGSSNVIIVQNSVELELFGNYLLGLYDRLVLQEYVGTPEHEYTVGVLSGSDGVLLNSIAIRRVIGSALTTSANVPNRSDRKELGERLVISSGVSQGYIVDAPEIRKQSERIAEALNARAPINIQCRFVNGAVMPFEVNPRFSGTTSLRAMVGYNEPDILFRRDVLGEKIEPYFSYNHGLILRSLCEQIIKV